MLLRLGACEIDLAAREVRLAGQVRAIEPRAYALLACLAERGNRVVTKKELLETVWPGRNVSDASLARAVMKARRAIGDTGEPPLIRTIPRVGYRLSLESAAPPVEDPLPPAKAAAAPLRIALLPFENATGDPALEWLEFGLMSLVAHTIGLDARLSPVAMQSLLAAVDGARATGHDLVESVRRATGAHVVVRSRVSKTADHYEIHFDCAETAAMASVRAASAGELPARMAAALEDLLFPGAAADATQLYSDDPMAVAAFARGLQAMARQKYPQAANLLRMALDLAPGSALLQLELLRALCGLGDLEAARPIARRLLARAERHGDVLLTARVHSSLSVAHAFHMAFVPAAYHAEMALRLMADDGPLDERAQAHLLRAQLAAFRQDAATTEQSLERLRALCEKSGNRVLLLSRTVLLATMARDRADYERSARLSMQAAQGAQELQVPRITVTAAINCAADLALLGRWTEAVVHVEEAFAAALLLDNTASIASVGPSACWVYRLTGTPAASRRVIDAMPPADSLPPLARQWVVTARAHHAAAEADHAASAELFAQALQLLRESGNRVNERDIVPWLVCSLVRSGRLDEADAALAEAPRAPADNDDECLRWLLHGKALVAHARGSPEQALEHLLDLAEKPTAALWRAWAVLDAAWLQAEAGDGTQALATLRQLPPAFASQPLAHAVATRAHLARDDRATARRMYQRYRDAVRHRVPQPCIAELGSACDRGEVPPPAPCLPSQL